MRTIIFLVLLLSLTAWAASGQVSTEQSGPVEVPPQALSQPTTVAPALGSSVLLFLRNEAQQRDEIHAVDPATGQDVPGYRPISLGQDFSFTSMPALSRDGQKLAMAAGKGQSCEPSGGGMACMGSAEVLHLLDRPTWREVTATLPAKGWVGLLAFNPAATHLALVHHERGSNTLMLFDMSTRKMVTQRALEFRPTLLAYSQDGTTVITYGSPLGSDPGITQPGPPVVLLLDATNLEVKWEQTLTNLISGYWCLENCQASHEEQLFAYWTPAVVLSPDRHKLYLVHADEESLTTVDFDARAVHSTEIQVAQSWFESFLALTAGVAEAKGATQGAFKNAVLSPDGKQLYAVGRTYEATPDTDGHRQTTEVWLGLQVIDVESGRKIASHASEATGIKITPDGVYLVLDGWEKGEPWTEVLDADSLEVVARLEKWEVVVTRRLDGQPVILASQPSQRRTRLAMLNPRSFHIIRSWSVNTYASWVVNP